MNKTQSMIDMNPKRFCRALDQVLGHLPPCPPATLPAPAGRGGEATVALLHPRLSPRLLEDLAADVAAPVQVVETERSRTVTVLRMYAVVFDRATGLARTALLREDGARLAAIDRPVPTVRLLHSPQGRDWTWQWLTRWCMRNGYACKSPALKRLLKDAANQLGRLACRTLDLRGMRRAIAQALAWDPAHWRRAVRLAHAAHLMPDQRDYNGAIRFAAQLDALEREAPHLAAPWFALACEGKLACEAEPTAALKQWVRKNAGGERAWKSLASSPARAWMAWGRRAEPVPTRHLRDTALLVKQCATGEPVPLPFLRLATGRLDPDVSIASEIRRGRMRHYPFALRAAKEAIARGTWKEFVAEFDTVDAWFYAEPPALDKLQRRRGWPWLSRKAAAWAEMQRRRQRAREALIPELPPVTVGGHVFHAARTPFDLWDAGRRLSNCLGLRQHERALADGEALLVLATRSRDGRLVAAAELRAEDDHGLRIVAARGFANGPVPRELERPLLQAAAHFEALRRARLLPWAIGTAQAPVRPLAACALPSPLNAEATDLMLASDGSVRLGRREPDYSTLPIAQRFVTTRIVRGGQAQRLADHAAARAGTPVGSLAALATAIASALAAAPGYQHWLTAFGATVPDPEAATDLGAEAARGSTGDSDDTAAPPEAAGVIASDAPAANCAADGEAIDLDFRPGSYFAHGSDAEELLRRIRGTHRREQAQQMLASGTDPAEVMRLVDDSQPPGLREMLMAIHPALSGGEYLPPLEPGEVEIARMELVGSVLGDVVSVRARPDGDSIAYSIVDEHGGDYTPGIERSDGPLALRELVALMERSDPPLGIAGLQAHLDAGSDAEGLRGFMRMRSTVYPQLHEWYEREIESFLRQESGAEATDDDDR